MRVLKLIFFGAMLLVIAASSAALIFADRLVICGVEWGGERFLGLPTTLEGAEVSLMDGTLELRGLTVMGPGGTERLLFVQRVFARAEVSSFGENPVRITELSILGPELSFWPGIDLNLPGSPEPKKKGTARRNEEAIRVRVARLAIVGARVLAASGERKVSLVVPDLVLKDLGGAEGASPGELAALLMGELAGIAPGAAPKEGGLRVESNRKPLGMRLDELGKRFFK